MGWLRRTNFREEGKDDTDWIAKQAVARKLATIILDTESVLYRQWFCGNQNIVADSLSRDALYLDKESHTFFLKTFTLKQLPKNFHLKEVPKEICCFITSTLQSLPEKEQRSKELSPSEMLLGSLGSLSSIKSACQNVDSLKECLNSKGTSWSAHLRKQFEKLPSPKEIENIWLKEQSVPPSHMWLRPSGQTIGATPDWTRTVKCASYCKNNIEDTGTTTELSQNKKPSP